MRLRIPISDITGMKWYSLTVWCSVLPTTHLQYDELIGVAGAHAEQDSGGGASSEEELSVRPARTPNTSQLIPQHTLLLKGPLGEHWSTQQYCQLMDRHTQSF